MADIKLNDLQPAGSEFFADHEGFMSDLSEDELSVWGGTGGGGDCSCGGGNNSIANSNITAANSNANSLLNTFGNSVGVSIV